MSMEQNKFEAKEYLRGNRLVYKCIVGSKAYGTFIEGKSDIDYKGIYIQSQDDILSFRYNEQIEIGKDECYYEIRRFLQLAQSANPTILEMLFVDDKFIVETSPAFELLRKHKYRFLTKKCCMSFGGYAVAQIKKAKGLDKKMNWEKERIERKTPFDFCYVYENGKTVLLEKWLGREKLEKQYCGLAALNHFKDCYALYYDYKAKYQDELTRSQSAYYFRGICIDEGNALRLSSIPEEANPECIIHYNRDGYSMHCKDYKEYINWLENRNTQRYVDLQGHSQKVDGKNLLHCRRLLDMAIEIARDKTITVLRPNAEYLLRIRKGEVPLDEIIEKAEQDIKGLDELYDKSDLPTTVDMDFVNKMLLEVRHLNF